MQRPSRPPNPSDRGSSAVKETEFSERDPQAVGAASAQTSRTNDGGNPISTEGGEGGGGGGGEPDSRSWCSRAHANQSLLQKRSKLHSPRRPSSGYISDYDSLPSSPRSPTFVTTDKATQTPSPTGQVMTHALQRAAQAEEQAQGGGPGTHQQHGHAPNPPSVRRGNGAADMQAQQLGRELRVIGDDYNRLLLLRRPAGGRRPAVIPLNLLPHIHQEPVALLCVSLLLLVIGRIMYFQGGTNGPDHSQV